MKRKKKNRVVPKPQETPIKMSEILMNYAWSYAIQDVEDPNLRQEFMNVVCFAWNFSLLPEEECKRAITNLVNNTRTVHRYLAQRPDPRPPVQMRNPYRLALDIHGIGFKTADTLAMTRHRTGFSYPRPGGGQTCIAGDCRGWALCGTLGYSGRRRRQTAGNCGANHRGGGPCRGR